MCDRFAWVQWPFFAKRRWLEYPMAKCICGSSWALSHASASRVNLRKSGSQLVAWQQRFLAKECISKPGGSLCKSFCVVWLIVLSPSLALDRPWIMDSLQDCVWQWGTSSSAALSMIRGKWQTHYRLNSISTTRTKQLTLFTLFRQGSSSELWTPYISVYWAPWPVLLEESKAWT